MTINIYTWNLNGIRAATKNGFFEWLEKSKADIVFLQETRALPEQLQPECLEPHGYKSFWHPAEKKGYSGVAIYTKLPVKKEDIVIGLGNEEFDNEGRFIGMYYGNAFYASTYFPNSQTEGKRLDYKLSFCDSVHKKLNEIRKKGFSIVLGGDINVAHTEIDLANPKQNQKSPGYFLEERNWVTHFLQDGYLDSFRIFEKKGGFYTWWSNFGKARERNIGWRIDTHYISEDLLSKVNKVKIHSDVLGSDHCPVQIEIQN